MIRRLRSILFAIAIGAIIVVCGNVATDIALGDALFGDGALGSIDALDVAVGHLIFTSFPTIVLGLSGSNDRVLWATAVLLTITFWCYFVYQIWQDSLNDFAGGANIGLGMLAMVSPLITLFVVMLVSVARRATRAH